jgi:hypothetical protein
MKIYEILTASYLNSDRNQEICAYVASKEIVEDYIHACIPEITSVTDKKDGRVVWASDWKWTDFPGFAPGLVYRDKENCIFFREIEVIEN